jgi:hypothetical protein
MSKFTEFFGKMDPAIVQMLMGMGSGMLSQPYTRTPQSGFEPFGRGLAAGNEAYQSALILQQRQAEQEAEEQARREKELTLAAQQAQQQAGLQSLMKSSNTPIAQRQQYAALAKSIGEGGAGDAALALMKAQNPEPPDLGLSTHIHDASWGLFGKSPDQITDPAQQKQIAQEAVNLRNASRLGQASGIQMVYDPESGRITVNQGPGVQSGAVTGSAPAASGAGVLPEAVADINKALESSDQIGELIYNPIMQDAVGPQTFGERIPDHVKNDPRYRHREGLKRHTEEMVLKIGGDKLKGNQTEKEWGMVRDTIPGDFDHAEVWEDWYDDFGRFQLMEFDSGSNLYNARKKTIATRMNQRPMTRAMADFWLETGDVYEDRDTGKTYRKD